jgi:hypothetical protein
VRERKWESQGWYDYEFMMSGWKWAWAGACVRRVASVGGLAAVMVMMMMLRGDDDDD